MITPTKAFSQMSVQEIISLAQPDSEYNEIRKHWPPSTLDISDQSGAISRLRMFTTLTEEMDEMDPAVEELDLYTVGRDDDKIRVHVWRSRAGSQQESNSPLIVLYHGGGFSMGSPTQMAKIARILVKRFDAVVAAPAYRLAPEHPFPCGINDCWDSLKWIAKNAEGEMRAHPDSGFIIGGYSAGATISVVLSHLARDEKLQPPLTGVWNSCGSCRLVDGQKMGIEYDMRLLSRQQEEMKNDPLLSADMQKLFLQCLKPDPTSKLYAPMVWPTSDNHKHLPPTYFQICGLDAGRDEGLLYNELLEKDGIATRVHLYPGMPHCFYLALPDMKPSRQWPSDTIEGFKWLLKR